MRAFGWNVQQLALAAAVAVAGCSSGNDGPKEQYSSTAINDTVANLSYDPASLLQVRPIESGDQLRTPKGEPVDTDEVQGSNLLACRQVDYDLDQNFDEIAILRPTTGIVWPGALVKANAALLNGMPEPLTLDPAPVTLAVDLPGIGDHGTLVVDKPSNSSVQAAIAGALSWWNDNAYIDGYRNPASSSYQSSASFSQEQLALDVKLNVKWASGSVASQFNYSSSTTQSVAAAVYKQVFYTVTLDTPSEPAAMFAETVMPSQARAQLIDASPPAYVSTVSYGRILLFRLESSEAISSTDMKAALDYAGGVSVSAEVGLKLQSILNKSALKVVAIGGDPEPVAELVRNPTFNTMADIIAATAVYTKSNPGVPIAYTVRFLKDNSIAKMGYTTSYTATDCNLWKSSRFTIHHSGAYVARAYARYYPWKTATQATIGTGNYTAGLDRVLTVPAGATHVELWAEAATGLVWAPWDQIGYVSWDIAPESACYSLHGTTLSNSWSSCN